MTTSIRKRVCLLAACAVLSTSAVALADGPNGGGQDPPTNPPPPGHDALLVPQVSVVDALVQALPVLIQTLVL